MGRGVSVNSCESLRQEQQPSSCCLVLKCAVKFGQVSRGLTPSCAFTTVDIAAYGNMSGIRQETIRVIEVSSFM